jgi:hypothetical protein
VKHPDGAADAAEMPASNKAATHAVEVCVFTAISTVGSGSSEQTPRGWVSPTDHSRFRQNKALPSSRAPLVFDLEEIEFCTNWKGLIRSDDVRRCYREARISNRRYLCV